MACFIVFKLFISFSLSVSDTVLNEKLKLHFSRIALILGSFWYLYIAAKTSYRYFLMLGKVTCWVL